MYLFINKLKVIIILSIQYIITTVCIDILYISAFNKKKYILYIL